MATSLTLFLCRILYSRNHFRHCSTKERTFTVLYKWPTMKLFRVISRFKIYQAGAMTVSTLPLSYWYSVGTISGNSLITGCSAATGTILVLCGLSYAFSRVLGELAYCHNTQTVRLSHLNFIGLRCDNELQLTDIVPFPDSQSVLHASRYIHRLETTVTKGAYLYSLRYGLISDREMLRYVIGFE